VACDTHVGDVRRLLRHVHHCVEHPRNAAVAGFVLDSVAVVVHPIVSVVHIVSQHVSLLGHGSGFVRF